MHLLRHLKQTSTDPLNGRPRRRDVGTNRWWGAAAQSAALILLLGSVRDGFPERSYRATYRIGIQPSTKLIWVCSAHRKVGDRGDAISCLGAPLSWRQNALSTENLGSFKTMHRISTYGSLVRFFREPN